MATNTLPLEARITQKMREAGLATPTITAFLDAVHKVQQGETGLWPEAAIEPVTTLPSLGDLEPEGLPAQARLMKLAVIKLNGGLGTTMGLERVKSLIPVKGTNTFLDYIARQILFLRSQYRVSEPAFYLMNSFNTRRDTLDYLQRYPALWQAGEVDFLQSRVPKLDWQTLEPAIWPAAPELEWCPPGHGDIYPTLSGSGLLDRLLGRGILYLFVSNSDNLGATVDLKLLEYFAASGLSFMMEVAERTPSDNKGGHLARRKSDGRFILREAAQCPKEDEGLFQDVSRHRFFNTNNLWLRLDHLREALAKHGGLISLPLIKNLKTIDPRDPLSPRVWQLESAMGAAIGCFENAGAVVTPRSRFAPVKTTSDLLAIRSDAYVETEDHCLVLAESRRGKPPEIVLDPRYYRVMAGFDRSFARGVPSLIDCDSLKVTGKLYFEPGVICHGRVELTHEGAEPVPVPAGIYRNGIFDF